MMMNLTMIRYARSNHGSQYHLTTISYDKGLQHLLRTLCTEFKDILSNELPVAPAKIPEFHLVVKETESKNPKIGLHHVLNQW